MFAAHNQLRSLQVIIENELIIKQLEESRFPQQGNRLFFYVFFGQGHKEIYSEEGIECLSAALITLWA